MDPHQDQDLIALILNIVTTRVSVFGLVNLAKGSGHLWLFRRWREWGEDSFDLLICDKMCFLI